METLLQRSALAEGISCRGACRLQQLLRAGQVGGPEVASAPHPRTASERAIEHLQSLPHIRAKYFLCPWLVLERPAVVQRYRGSERLP